MTRTAEHAFSTATAVTVQVEMGSGGLRLTATQDHAGRSTVVVDGEDAELVTVEHTDDRIIVRTPKQRRTLLGQDTSYDIKIAVPDGSRALVRTGSADVTGEGRWTEAQLRTGSGDVRFAEVDGPVEATTGSGDLRLGTVGADCDARTGSGDLAVEQLHATAVLRTGSGDAVIGQPGPDLTFTAGSGELTIRRATDGKLRLKAGSGDIWVGVTPDVPVWTDVHSGSGTIRSELVGAGEPAPGQPHLEVRATVGSGDITLAQL